MQAAMQLAGYEASEADSLRKAIAKKNEDKLKAHRKKFIKGAQEHAKISKNDAELIFKDWEEFARYGFNKSHAADYGVIAVQTAYLKYHYTVEYMTALLSAWKNDTSKISLYVADCRAMGIDVLPPDINTSDYDFKIEDRENDSPAIRFGLGAVKNVGEHPVNLILEARQEGPFENLTDFTHRVDLRHVGRRPLECLIKVGSLDRFGPRLALLNELERIIAISSSIFQAREAGQMILFQPQQSDESQIALPNVPYVNKREELNWERELIGLYVSDHPLSPYQKTLGERVTHFSHQLAEVENKSQVIVAGMIDRFRQHLTKKGNNMGFVTLEDLYGKIDLVIFPQVWEKAYHLVEMDHVLLAEGRVDAAQGDPKILVDKLTQVELDELINAQDHNLPDAGSDLSLEEEFLEDFLPDLPFDDAAPQQPEENAAQGDASSSMQVPPSAKPEDQPNDQAEETGQRIPHPETTHQESQAINLDDDDLDYDQIPLETEVRVSETIHPVTAYHVFKPSIPEPEPLPHPDQKPRCILITLDSCGDKQQDVNRLRRIHDILVSRPGRDQFAFRVKENGWWYEIGFPNLTIGLTDPLIRILEGLMGVNNINIAPL